MIPWEEHSKEVRLSGLGYGGWLGRIEVKVIGWV